MSILVGSTKSENTMRVQKRGSRGYEVVKFDKITDRLQNLCGDLPNVDPIKIAQSTIKSIYDGITTEELDKISAQIAESLKLIHPEYSTLAAKIMVSNLHKTTPPKFSECMRMIGENLDIKSARHYAFIAENARALDDMIIDKNDYLYDYFGFKTLENSYLTKIQTLALDSDGLPIYVDYHGNVIPSAKVMRARSGKSVTRNARGKLVAAHPRMVDKIVDRPQYMLMRVAIAIYIDQPNALQQIQQCYEAQSEMLFTHATPTLFNACAKTQQLNSCFLMGTEDSIEGIMRTLSNASFTSKWAGGIGIHMSNIRACNAWIRGTNGKSSGLPKQLKMYNEAARCWDQGGKRLGAFAIYLEPWHGDIMKFLSMKLPQGDESERARELFYAVWMPDLFMQRAEAGDEWSLFSPDTAPGLNEVHDGMEVCKVCGYCENPNYAKWMLPEMTNSGQIVHCVKHEYEFVDAFTQLYTRYEEEGYAINALPAREVQDAILHMQRESGTPYVCYKDHVNRMTNQKNIDTIKSSNLCCEIMEVSNANSYACCTLASINLRRFIAGEPGNYYIDHEKLHSTVRLVARNLDIIIDVNKYPVAECQQNSHDYRPIGIGVQALADTFAIMRLPFTSAAARKIDLEIMETIYHAALTESMERGEKLGSYSHFEGSPASRGQLAWQLWMQNNAVCKTALAGVDPRSGRYDWNFVPTAMRNSLLVAPMPTVSTSQIFGNNESFEPFPANIYVKTTLAGKFTVSNVHMIKHLIELGLWNESIRRQITNDNGSVQGVEAIPADVREIYKTVWEIKQSELLERTARRGAWVDQSQSFNVHVQNNSNAVLRGIMFAGWKLGLKTGTYYIRTRPAAQAFKTNLAAIAKENTDRTDRTDKKYSPVEYSKLPVAPFGIGGLDESDMEPMVCKMEPGCTMCSS